MNDKKNKLSIGTENIISLKDFADKLNKTKKIFPKVGLIYSASGYFKPEIYEQVIMSYNNPKLTKLLAKFVDYIFDITTSRQLIDNNIAMFKCFVLCFYIAHQRASLSL